MNETEDIAEKWFEYFWCIPEELFDMLSTLAAKPVTWMHVAAERYDREDIFKVLSTAEFTFPAGVERPPTARNGDGYAEVIHEMANFVLDDARITSLEVA
jgi:hypothetical protein